MPPNAPPQTPHPLAHAHARPPNRTPQVASGGTVISSGGGLEDRYAAALYSHAEDLRALDSVVEQMDTLGRLIDAFA